MAAKSRLYRLYGLTLDCPLVLPCPRARAGARADVQLRRGNAAPFARARTAAGRGRARSWFHCGRLADGAIYLRWTGIFEFLVSADGRRIRYRRLDRATAESLGVYLLGQVLSFSLLARGVDPLHGTVIDVGGAAIAFLGDPGRGKSTLAAAFLARGYPIVTDDLVALDPHGDGWVVHPGVPRLKLFPSVVRRLLGHRLGGAMIHGTSKRVLPLGANESVQEALPLKAIYVLSAPEGAPGRRTAGRIRVERLSGSDAFVEVVRAAFNLIVLERERYANQFAFAARLAGRVPVRRLTFPRAFPDLPAVCDALLADLAAI